MYTEQEECQSLVSGMPVFKSDSQVHNRMPIYHYHRLLMSRHCHTLILGPRGRKKINYAHVTTRRVQHDMPRSHDESDLLATKGSKSGRGRVLTMGEEGCCLSSYFSDSAFLTTYLPLVLRRLGAGRRHTW